MICYKDMTFCISPNCTGECEREFTDQDKVRADKSGLPVMFARFCGIEKDVCEITLEEE